MNSNRKPIIAGNWKMYKTAAEALGLVNGLKSELVGVRDGDIEAVICPPFTALYAVSTLLQGSNIQLGAQNVHWEKEGAFTGEIAATPFVQGTDVH